MVAIVVGPDDLTGLGAGALARVKRLAPTVLLVAYLPNDRCLPQLAFQLGHVGVDVLCIRDVDDQPAALREHVRQALSRMFVTQVASRVETAAPGLPPHVVESALLRIADVKRPRDLASSLEMSLPRLRSTLKVANLPSPRRFLLWCRLLLAARLLEDDARTVEAVASWLDYGSAPALRNACRKLLRSTPTVIRRGGGLAFVAHLFEAEVKAATPRPGPVRTRSPQAALSAVGARR
jgi:AraC-like DNA-binding protein